MLLFEGKLKKAIVGLRSVFLLATSWPQSRHSWRLLWLVLLRRDPRRPIESEIESNRWKEWGNDRQRAKGNEVADLPDSSNRKPIGSSFRPIRSLGFTNLIGFHCLVWSSKRFHCFFLQERGFFIVDAFKFINEEGRSNQTLTGKGRTLVRELWHRRLHLASSFRMKILHSLINYPSERERKRKGERKSAFLRNLWIFIGDSFKRIILSKVHLEFRRGLGKHFKWLFMIHLSFFHTKHDFILQNKKNDRFYYSLDSLLTLCVVKARWGALFARHLARLMATLTTPEQQTGVDVVTASSRRPPFSVSLPFD